MRGFPFKSLYVIVRGGQEEELVAGTSLITLMHPVTWARCSQTVCGDVEASGKHEALKIYNTS